MKRSFFRKFLLLLPVLACCLLCSCTTAMTLGSMGRETFIWSPEDMNVSIRTKLDKSFLEHKTVCILKTGTLKKYYLPYDICTEEKVSRTVEVPVDGNLPVLTVRVEKNAKSVMNRCRKNQILLRNDSLDFSFAGQVESVRPRPISPEDFQLLQQPFWFTRGKMDYSYCVPMKPIKIDSYYQIPVLNIQPGGFPFLAPDELRVEEKYWRGFGISCARFTCSILPFVFDVATSPIQLIVFTLI